MNDGYDIHQNAPCSPPKLEPVHRDIFIDFVCHWRFHFVFNCPTATKSPTKKKKKKIVSKKIQTDQGSLPSHMNDSLQHRPKKMIASSLWLGQDTVKCPFPTVQPQSDHFHECQFVSGPRSFL